MFRDDNMILVMYEDTYEALKETIVETTDMHSDLIAFLKEINSIEIVADNEVPFGFTEMWNKEQYNKFKNYKKGF